MTNPKPKAYMMLGLPGSGKTTYSKKLQTELGLVRFALDEEYFARVGNKQQEQRDFEIERQVSEEIQVRVADLIEKGQSIVLDFCPWNEKVRKEYVKWLRSIGADVQIYFFDVPKKELLKRLETRNSLESPDHQYMTPQMLEDFYKRFDRPESENVIVIT